jgi:hypothetical protein
LIFDSPEIERLRIAFENKPDYNVPSIIRLDRMERLIDEKCLLEEIFQQATVNKQKEWLGRLTARDEEQFQSAWYEMMLWKWLVPAGKVEVEPELLGNTPDFLLKTAQQEIVIEAKALLISQSEREIERWKAAFFSAIKNIKLPYAVGVSSASLKASPDIDQFIREVHYWLISEPENKYIFEDRFGNILICTSQHSSTLKNADLVWSADEAKWLNPDVIKPALQEKAKSNKAIRRANYPYIVALYLEDFLYSVEEVVNAWFGNEVVVIDIDSSRVIETKRDKRGLHLYRREVSHRSVSGTLVFKAEGDINFRGRVLRGWYIENPYANVKVDTSVFPVEASWIVIEKTEHEYRMGWVSKQG